MSYGKDDFYENQFDSEGLSKSAAAKEPVESDAPQSGNMPNDLSKKGPQSVTMDNSSLIPKFVSDDPSAAPLSNQGDLDFLSDDDEGLREAMMASLENPAEKV